MWAALFFVEEVVGDDAHEGVIFDGVVGEVTGGETAGEFLVLGVEGGGPSLSDNGTGVIPSQI